MNYLKLFEDFEDFEYPVWQMHVEDEIYHYYFRLQRMWFYLTFNPVKTLSGFWSAKYSEEIFAIGRIESYSNGIVSGGTGWAVAMSIQNTKTVYVYDLIKNKWFKWSYIIDKFIEIKETPIIQSKNFAGIGTRKLTKEGEEAIEDVFKKTYKEF